MYVFCANDTRIIFINFNVSFLGFAYLEEQSLQEKRPPPLTVFLALYSWLRTCSQALSVEPFNLIMSFVVVVGSACTSISWTIQSMLMRYY